MDYAATTPTDPAVVKAMSPYFNKKFANPASLYSLGLEAKEALEKSRIKIAEKINARPEEIIFTASATESNNLAIKGFCFANKNSGNHIIISAIEHDCVLASAAWLEKQGFELTIVNPEKNGVINPEKIAAAIKPTTILVSIMAVNNEIGTIQPISEIGKICRKKNISFHTDAAQAFGKIPLDVKSANIDLMTLSSHKVYGPKGVGCLFVGQGIKIEPILHGGGQEFGMRSGTVNVAGIVGFAKAAEMIVDNMEAEQKRISELARKLVAGAKQTIADVELNGDEKIKVPNIVNLRFARIEGESLLVKLDIAGVEVSTGSACSSPKLKPSHVLMSCGATPEQAHGSVRFSIGRFTTQEDIDRVLAILPKAVDSLRKISPIK